MEKRAMVVEHLAQAQRHVAQGLEHVSRQRELIERLAQDGHDTVEAELLLKTFLELQVAHESDCQRLTDELASIDAR